MSARAKITNSSVSTFVSSFCLHGLNAVYLDIGWLRPDARGSKQDVNALFAPPAKHLAFRMDMLEEYDFPEIWPDPLPCVIQRPGAHTDYAALLADLPDIDLTAPHAATHTK